MPSWREVAREIEGTKVEQAIDQVRTSYLHKLHEREGKNVIAYYSGWLFRPKGPPVMAVNDGDKNALMSVVQGLDRSKGLDLILHTPGGDVAATESLVDYLRQMFGTNMRAIVPQISMSAGTMMACACQSILMGKQSNLGPIDPQINGIPAAGVVAEFKRAIKEVKRDPQSTPIWQAIVGKYPATYLQGCERAVKWAREVTMDWLRTGMFADDPDPAARAEDVTLQLIDDETQLNHARHIHIEKLKEIGLRIEQLEDDDELQDLVLTIHHCYMHTFNSTNAVKMIENHKGVRVVHHQASN